MGLLEGKWNNLKRGGRQVRQQLVHGRELCRRPQTEYLNVSVICDT